MENENVWLFNAAVAIKFLDFILLMEKIVIYLLC